MPLGAVELASIAALGLGFHSLVVDATKAGGPATLVNGGAFTSGLGVHSIHEDQVDSGGTRCRDENGIWQDGCTILQPEAGAHVAFLNKFTLLSHWTGDSGHPRYSPGRTGTARRERPPRFRDHEPTAERTDVLAGCFGCSTVPRRGPPSRS